MRLCTLERGEPVPPGLAGPLELRLRAVFAQWDSVRGRAAQRMAETVWSASPHLAVYQIATTPRRLSVDRRAELHTDLGEPPIPDEHFWATLGNPAVDTSSCARRYAEERG